MLILRIDEKSNMKYFLYLNANNNFYYWLEYLLFDLFIVLLIMICILLIGYINGRYSFDLIKIMTFILLGIFIFFKIIILIFHHKTIIIIYYIIISYIFLLIDKISFSTNNSFIFSNISFFPSIYLKNFF